MEYVVVDVKCEKFIEIMSKTGGFVANMTTRLFEKEKLDVYYMMLVAIPQATNSFLFNFVYLDKNKQLLKCYKDSDCMDYIYFRKKFESCTVSRGSAGTGKTYQVLEIAKQVNPCKVIVVSDHPEDYASILPNIEIHSIIDFMVNSDNELQVYYRYINRDFK